MNLPKKCPLQPADPSIEHPKARAFRGPTMEAHTSTSAPAGGSVGDPRQTATETQANAVPGSPELPSGGNQSDKPGKQGAKSRRPTGRGRNRGLQSAKHGRFIAPDINYHIVFKTLQSRYLLRPDAQGELRDLLAGVIGRARRNWPRVSLFAATFLSTHGHMMLQGPAPSVAAFIGFIKREISRRWGPKVGWTGPMWARYHATAVITEAAQVRCLKYVLSQSVKELVVERPEDWPGFHCAPALMSGEPILGQWLNATEYGRARHRALRRKDPVPDRASFLEAESLNFDPIPAWADKPAEQHRAAVQKLVVEIVLEAERARQDRGLGQPDVTRVLNINPMARGRRPTGSGSAQAPRRRRRMIAWDDLRAPELRNYLRRYWRFQGRFRACALRLLHGDLAVEFPACAFRPGFAQERCTGEEKRRAAQRRGLSAAASPPRFGFGLRASVSVCLQSPYGERRRRVSAHQLATV